MKNIKILINEYHYKKGSKSLIFLPLGLISIFYSIAISTKNLLYKICILKEKKVKPYVICVGNLTTGGVGKTPIVCEIANYIANTLGKKTAIISRGYGAKLNNKNINIIKDYQKIYFNDAQVCGDEALLCAKNTTNCAVLTCSNRTKAANFAHKNFGAEVVVLDDGFSNRKIKKDFSVLVIDSKKQFGNGALLPLGPLREPVSESKRADYFVISNKNDSELTKAVSEITKKIKNNKVSVCNFVEDYFYNIKNGLKIIPSNQKAVAFCAIGQPEQFYDYLKKRFDVAFTKTFEDHYSYTQNDIDHLTEQAKKDGANAIITTQKDEVKIIPFVNNMFVSLKLKAQFSDMGLFWAIEKGIKNETKWNLQK